MKKTEIEIVTSHEGKDLKILAEVRFLPEFDSFIASYADLNLGGMGKTIDAAVRKMCAGMREQVDYYLSNPPHISSNEKEYNEMREKWKEHLKESGEQGSGDNAGTRN